MTTFLHPWALLIGAAAAALPIAVHLLTRPRPTVLPLSTVRFVRTALNQRKARHRLRDAIVLGLRMLAIGLLAAAVARPLFGDRPLVAADEPGTAARVVILDVSQSLAAQQNGVMLFERARPLAAGYLSDQPGLHANLILAGAVARPAFPRLSANTGALRDELARAKPRPERLNLAAALTKAGELLAQAPGRRELVIVSDFQRSHWASADFAAIPDDARIQFDSVAPSEALANLGILRVGASGRAEDGRDVHVEVDVGNYSPTPRRVQVELTLGDASAQLDGMCPPNSRTTLNGDIALRGAGWKSGVARLVDVHDALAADNSRPFVLESRPAPTLALITRQPADGKSSSSYFLERALSPLAPRPDRPGIRVVRLDPGHFERDAVADADVLVFDHPGKLPAAAPALIAGLMRRGRGVLYVAGESADATNLQQIAEAAGSDLQLPVEFAPATGQRRHNLILTDVRRDVPPFSIFGDGLPTLTGSLRFAGGLSTRRSERALADDILASFNDRSAALIVTNCGAGILAVLNADLAASDLPRSQAFVPLVGELIGRLLGKPRAGDAHACGEPSALVLPSSAGPAAGLRIVAPDGPGDPAQLAEEGGGVVWRSPSLDVPGVYRIERQAVTVFGLAAAVPAEECDLRPLDALVLTGRLAGGRAVHFRAVANDDGEQRDRLWTWLAVACAACLLGEVMALKLFRT